MRLLQCSYRAVVTSLATLLGLAAWGLIVLWGKLAND